MPHPGAEAVAVDAKNGVMLSSWWIAAPAEGRRPAIIALHGCGGLYRTGGNKAGAFNARHAAMADLLRDAGYHVLWLDSFSARGTRSICTEKTGERSITLADRRADVFAGLQWLASRPDVDASRIALLGWSNGGATVLSSIDVSRANVRTHLVQPRAAIAFYPGCGAALKNPAYRNATPLLILTGASDDWTPPEPCIAFERMLNERQSPVTLRLYADSHHDFDAPGMPVRVRRDVSNGAKPGAGVTVGSNPAARDAAYAEMFDFLKRHLQ